MMIRYSVLLPHFERPALLSKTLLAYGKFRRSDLEVVVVDDCSGDNQSPIIPSNLPYPVKLVKLKGRKSEINPAVPMQVAAWHAEGEQLILTSPEITPLHDFITFGEQNIEGPYSSGCYYIFNVFAVTSSGAENGVLRKIIELCLNEENGTKKEELRDLVMETLSSGLGHRGYPWANEYGSWYQHPIHRCNDLHFLTMISASDFWERGGFNPWFRRGAGYEDLEFRNRLAKTLTFRRFDGISAIHFEHEEVSARSDVRVRTNSNQIRYVISNILNAKPRQKLTLCHGHELIYELLGREAW